MRIADGSSPGSSPIRSGRGNADVAPAEHRVMSTEAVRPVPRSSSRSWPITTVPSEPLPMANPEGAPRTSSSARRIGESKVKFEPVPCMTSIAPVPRQATAGSERPPTVMGNACCGEPTGGRSSGFDQLAQSSPTGFRFPRMIVSLVLVGDDNVRGAVTEEVGDQDALGIESLVKDRRLLGRIEEARDGEVPLRRRTAEEYEVRIDRGDDPASREPLREVGASPKVELVVGPHLADAAVALGELEAFDPHPGGDRGLQRRRRTPRGGGDHRQ